MSLDSAISFSTECYQDASKPIGGITFNSEMFGDSEDHRPYFIENCGDIVITGCIFDHCYSINDSPGGSLFIKQNCNAIIHNTIFNFSHTSSATGGAIFACNSIDDKAFDFKNEQLKSLDIQYCCFQNCYGDGQSESKLYGVAVFSSATNNLLYYASTVNCPGPNKPKSMGALFDLQGDNVTSQYVNCTGGNSNFCGGIEYRHANKGFFKFQTISDMSCMFAVSYTNFTSNDIELSMSNIKNVKIVRGSINDERVLSGLIHIRQTHNIIISYFAFIGNNLDDESYKHDKDTLIDYKKIISRGFYGQGIEYADVILDNCYYDCSDDKIIITSNYKLETKNCHPNANEDNLNHIEQLYLGECKGKVSAAPLTPTMQFTETDGFTKTNEFESTDGFSKSNYFSKTSGFTKTDVFSLTNKFSFSNPFSNSDIFGFGNHNTDDNKVNVGMIAGIVGAVAASAVIAALVAFFIIKKKRSLVAEEDVETIDSQSNNSLSSVNPIYDHEGEDDPFKEDFS